MSHTACFYFHGSLNDFLRRPKRATWFAYTFIGHPAVKDAIEAIGIPHLEVREVLINDLPVPLTHQLQPEDRVAVFPFDGRESELLQGIAAFRFVLDVHLGKLAKSLRLLGFDAAYDNALTDKAIVAQAQTEQRIVLTRDVNLLKHKAIPVGYWLRSQQTEEQLAAVIRRFRLLEHSRPFTRCMVCNGNISEVTKAAVLDLLPPKTKRYFQEFYQCENCRRVYWKGSHYERMQELVRRLAADRHA
ncbi:hypothetical protein H9Q13_00825 [Pontibacter sp. JH31]|uniref:Twitching motility protein PilT n=1 Tax=Pontibacter aquaedesilientis TaxID=2766980 RepID=A0ABR7XBK4_9BACT|nr:Mut7-C RNAse domain-containing protein [Pontibacter aquaedesilientis]MBD1395695.1 hypothetical protein [Pontibacter aquaedesilientis]